jgi:hypothetical protein
LDGTSLEIGRSFWKKPTEFLRKISVRSVFKKDDNFGTEKKVVVRILSFEFGSSSVGGSLAVLDSSAASDGRIS